MFHVEHVELRIKTLEQSRILKVPNEPSLNVNSQYKKEPNNGSFFNLYSVIIHFAYLTEL